MSTNKNKAPSVTKNVEKLNHETCKKIAQKVADDHKGSPKPQLLHKVVKPEDPSKVLYPHHKGKKINAGDVLTVCWMPMGERWKWERDVMPITFILDFTKLNRVPTKADADKQIAEQIKMWRKRGRFFSEEEAYRDFIVDVERVIGHQAHEMKYHPMCPMCSLEMANGIFESMCKAREWIDYEVPRLRKMVDVKSAVIPDLNHVEIKDRKWVEKTVKTCKCGGKCHCKKDK